MDDDQQAIDRVLGGDAESFRVLVERYGQSVFRLARNLVRDAAECEDVAQETFLAAFRHLGRFDSRRAKFSTWLLTIARNQCINALSKRRPMPMEIVLETIDSTSPVGETTGEEIHRRLDAALEGLPLEQKTAFVLAEFEGLSYDQIGRIEGVKLGTVKSRISRAKDKLQRALQDLVERS